MFVYTSGKTSISVDWDDYSHLEQGEFLNDTVIEFYLQWLYDQWPEEKQKSCHIFNSFFYESMSSKPKGAYNNTGGYVEKPIDRETQIVNYEKIRRWTRNDEVFWSRFVFVPICEEYGPGVLSAVVIGI
jgi:sentrin-specific protease 7